MSGLIGFFFVGGGGFPTPEGGAMDTFGYEGLLPWNTGCLSPLERQQWNLMVDHLDQ